MNIEWYLFTYISLFWTTAVARTFSILGLNLFNMVDTLHMHHMQHGRHHLVSFDDNNIF